MKKLTRLRLLLSAGMICSSIISMFGVTVTKDNISYDVNTTTNTAQVNGPTSKDIVIENLVIPDEVEYNGTQYPVTSISGGAFEDCSSLTEVRLPDGLTSISYYAFSNCQQLQSIHIPDGVKEISFFCFYNCSSLTELRLPEGLTSIGVRAFSNCTQLQTNNIPDGVKEIGSYCFYECSSLTELRLPEGLTYIGDYAFYRCSQLQTINIPDGIKEIPEYCFWMCSSLKEMRLPEGLTSIGKYAFEYCNQLQTINIPDGVTSIGIDAFASCTQLQTVNIPDGIKVIPMDCFLLCSSLTELTLPDGLTSIGKYAFQNCSQLQTINIPDGVKEIPYKCFELCSSLTELRLPDGLTSIDGFAFYGCSQLQTINIPNGIKEIPESCFKNCSSLAELSLPEGLISIGNEAFEGCSQLTELTSLNPTPPVSESFPPNLKTVYVPFGAKAAYETADGWNKYNIIELAGTLEGNLKVQDFEINAAQTKEVTVDFVGELNGNLYSGFQFDINLPQGISVTGVTLNESLKADGFQISNTATDKNKIRVVCFNASGKTSELTDGILTLTVAAAANAPNGESKITITKASFTNRLGEDLFLEDSETTVTISNIPVTGFTIEPSEEENIYVGQSVTFSATVVPQNATNQNFTWSLDNEEDGYVEIEKNENGEITLKGLKLGTATLSVTAEDFEGYSATVTVNVVPTPAETVVVSATDLILLEGTTSQLTATVYPEDTTDQTITWASDAEDVATISQGGLVTAIKAGEAKISATCGDAVGYCTVTVKAIEDITVIPGDGSTEGDEEQNPGENTGEGMAVVGDNLTLRVGQTGTVTLKIEPGVDYDPALEWSLATEGESYVQMTVDEDDSLTATFKGLAVGKTTYTVRTPADNAEVLSGTITVIAENPVMSLTLAPEQISLAQNALPYQLTATITPESGATTPTLSWKSSLESVATVDTDGKVSPAGVGECDITVSTTDGTGLTAVCHVTVTAPIDDKFEFDFDESVMGGADGVSIYLGDSYQFIPKAQAGYVLPDNITWSSSEPTKVSVDDDGTVHGLELGQAVITASAIVNDQTVTATCTVNVIPIPAVSIKINGGGVESIKRKETLTLSATVLPANTTFPDVTWQSSSDDLATVSQEGVVTGQNPGHVTITAFVTEYPDVKDTYELEITDLLLGDSNDNGIVTVADVVTTANHLIEIPVASWSFVNADVTQDDEISMADVTGTVEIILNDLEYTATRLAKRAYAPQLLTDRLVSDNFRSGQSETKIDVKLENSVAYSALQATVILPEGMDVGNVVPGARLSDHFLLFNKPEEGVLKVVIFSFYNTEFAETDEALFTLVANTDNAYGDLRMLDIFGSDSKTNEYELGFGGGLNESVATNVEFVNGDNVVIRTVAEGIEVFNADGQCVNVYRYTGETAASILQASSYEKLSLEPGLYIVRAGNTTAKVVVK